jgi:hypothetical protein
MITDEQKIHYATASHYIVERREKKIEISGKTYPICRGDILLLVVLIEQELKAAAPIADLKRLAAIREKLGNLVHASPEMSKEEAQQFR